MNLDVVILAAGEGKRINSYESKVLMKVAHKHMVNYVLEAATELTIGNDHAKIVLVASENNENVLRNILENTSKHFTKNISSVNNSQFKNLPYYFCAVQQSQQGTGHAAKVGVELLESQNDSLNSVLFLYGDTPLVNPKNIKNALLQLKDADVVVFGMDLDSITDSKYLNIIRQNHYGRIFFDYNGNVIEIREKCNLSDCVDHCVDQQKFMYNSGIMYLSKNALKLLQNLPSHKINCTNQYYLTDIVELAKKSGLVCKSITMPFDEMVGVNSKEELAFVECIMQEKLRKKHMENGAILLNPESVYFSHDTKIGKDAVIYPNVFFEENVTINDRARVLPFSFLSDCIIYENASIGPFVTLRNSVDIHSNAQIGNFVEIKNSCIEKSVKIKHLSYVGDAHISEKANIGAGVIFCNFDGVNKNYSFVGKSVFIGSNSSIVAPISLGDEAIIAAGSVVTQDIPDNTLSITRAKQKNILQGASRYKRIKQVKQDE